MLELCYRALAELLNSGDGFITIEEFRPFCWNHENMLNPLFEVQNKLRKAAMGPAFWDSMSKRRITLSQGHSVELGELMVRVSFSHRFFIHQCSFCLFPLITRVDTQFT